MLARLRFDWARYPSLQTLTQAGGRLEPALAQQFAEQALLLGRRFFVMYGQTEATARMAWLAAHEVVTHPDAIGRAIPGGHFSLRELEGGKPGEGELVYRGDNVMLGYASAAEDLAQGALLQELATGDRPAVTRRAVTTSAVVSVVFSSCLASVSVWRRSRASFIAGAGWEPAVGVMTACWWSSNPMAN